MQVGRFHFYVRPIRGRWELGYPGQPTLELYRTRTLALKEAEMAAQARFAAEGGAIGLLIRSREGVWEKWERAASGLFQEVPPPA
ncbi:MAG: hypothetical protein EON85_14765 [Brevundimonas sp.]|nr:MAG: hypothetical protein EON85_14765 [Brevundimonas sp.]